jgi:hypothetical protein
MRSIKNATFHFDATKLQTLNRLARRWRVLKAKRYAERFVSLTKRLPISSTRRKRQALLRLCDFRRFEKFKLRLA